MTITWKSACWGAALVLCASTLPAAAQRIVSPGQTTYYFSGTTADPIDASLPATNPGRMGDTIRQADNILNKLKDMLAKNQQARSEAVVRADPFHRPDRCQLAEQPVHGGAGQPGFLGQVAHPRTAQRTQDL